MREAGNLPFKGIVNALTTNTVIISITKQARTGYMIFREFWYMANIRICIIPG
jgi:hypothetical protein